MSKKISKEDRPKYTNKINCPLLCIILGIPSLFIFLITVFFQECFRNGLLDFIEVFNANSTLFVCSLKDNPDFLGTAVWTLTTILSAIVILYYSIINYRNFGFTNRQIISYTYGSFTIPILIVYNTIIVIFMTIMYYMLYYTAFYLLAIYSFSLQLILIYICIYSTTRIKAYKTILSVEEKSFNQYCQRIQESRTEDYEKISFLIEEEKESLLFSLYSIMNGEETLAEKADIIIKVLNISFCFQFTDDVKWDLIYHDCIYRYQQNNFKILATYIDEEEDAYIVHELYSIIYKAIRWIRKQGCLSINKTHLFIWYGALFNSFIPKKSIEEKWSFLTHIVDDFFQREEREKLILELICAIQFQIYIGNLKLENKIEMDNIIWNVRKLSDFSTLDIKETFNVNEKIFRKLILSWAGNTTDKRSNQYGIYFEIKKAMKGEGRHDFIDYMIKYKEGIYGDKTI